MKTRVFRKIAVALAAAVFLSAAEAAGEQAKRVLFLGDSITDKRHIGCTKNYWGFLSERYGFEALVYGINGQQMVHIAGQAEKFRKTDGGNVDVIFVFAGTNDYNAGVPLGDWYSFSEVKVNRNGRETKLRKREFRFDRDTFRGRINLALSHLKESFPNSKIVLLTPVHRGYATFGPANVQQDESHSNPLGLFLDDYVAALKEAGNVWAVKVVDLHADSGLMPNLRSQDAFISKVDTDRLHPSDAGHRLIADAVSLAVGGWLESK